MDGNLGWYYGGDAYNNWDLNAVVRLGRGGVPALAPEPDYDDPFFAVPPPPQQDELFDAAVPWQEAQDLPTVDEAAIAEMEAFLSEALFAAPEPLPPSFPSNEAPPAPQQGPAAMEMEPLAVDNKQAEQQSSGGGSNRPRQMRRIRRDMQKKWVITVPSAQGRAADLWAWRKYGQKLIKGSLYPRSYYKCSSNKTCEARKLVDRCVADPGFVTMTYTGYHCHPVPENRSSIAGTMRPNRDAPGPSSQAATPAPLMVPAAPTPPRTVYVEFDEEEEEDDALALKALINNAAMAPENAFLFLNPADNVAPAPVTGGGGEGRNQLFPIPENMAMDASRGGAPIPNVVMDTSFVAPWEAAGPVAADWWGM